MKFSIKARLFLGFGIICLLVIVLGVVSINSLEKINDSMNEIESYGLTSVDYTHSINSTIANYRIKELRHVISEDDEEKSGLEEEMSSLDQEVKNNIESYGKVINSDVDREIINSVETDWEKYLGVSEKAIAFSKAENDQEALSLEKNELKEAFDNLSGQLAKLVDTNQEDVDKETDSANGIHKNTRIALFVVIIVVVIICFILALVITKSIVKPINKLMVAADTLALGDINVSVESTSKDEIGELMKAFKRMIENIRNQALAVEKIAGGDLTVEVPINSANDLLGNKLSEMVKKNNEVLSNIYASSEQVAAGAKQVSDSSILLSEGATEQASAIEELTASIEEISSQTDMNAQNANKANELADEAKSNAEQGNFQMREMLKAMDEINEASTNISKVIKVIDDIAFQTNILALNAAVEAARAGQHGKGFAVVAEEVRNLAARSANAAKETTEMIEGSIKKSEGGTKIAKDTAQALDRIVEGIEQVANLVGNIATASNEQASGIKQINQGIMQVSQVVQSNSATSEESAAASEELSSQAALLKETVNQFKIRKNTNTYGRNETLSPDVLKMLDNMQAAGKADSEQAPESHEKALNTKPKITLSDVEFGKY